MFGPQNICIVNRKPILEKSFSKQYYEKKKLMDWACAET